MPELFLNAVILSQFCEPSTFLGFWAAGHHDHLAVNLRVCNLDSSQTQYQNAAAIEWRSSKAKEWWLLYASFKCLLAHGSKRFPTQVFPRSGLTLSAYVGRDAKLSPTVAHPLPGRNPIEETHDCHLTTNSHLTTTKETKYFGMT